LPLRGAADAAKTPSGNTAILVRSNNIAIIMEKHRFINLISFVIIFAQILLFSYILSVITAIIISDNIVTKKNFTLFGFLRL
jgi:hypothetical protein